jgi:prepilin-type N-terminal cleavage/methylation domain-containing protein
MTRRRTSRARQRGVTLLEIMLSMAVLLVGMLGLFRVLSVAARGSSSAQRMTQGQTKAQQFVESIVAMPKAILDCLVTNAASTAWNSCETQCQTLLGGYTNAAQACVFTTGTMKSMVQVQIGTPVTMDMDSTSQHYAIVYDASNPAMSTWVQQVPGSAGHLYQVQVTMGWNDDGTAPSQPPYDHRVTLKTDVYRN